MNKNYKKIKDFEDYLIYEDGRVWSTKTNKFIKGGKNKEDGYCFVGLCSKGVLKNKYRHRLVAEAFIQNPNNYKCINHKDENKQNNNVENLEWCTAKYNNNYGERLQKISIKTKGTKRSEEDKQKLKDIWKEKINEGYKPNTSKKVDQYSKDGKFIKRWDSLTQVQKETGFTVSAISCCCRNKTCSAFGYVWRLSDDTFETRLKSNGEISQYDKNGNFIRDWEGVSEIYNTLGFAKSSIHGVCCGSHKMSHGYIWAWKNKKIGE